MAFFLKKIASIGVWGNGRFPQLNLPSALAVAKQGYSFLFAYPNVSDCFYSWLDAANIPLKTYFHFKCKYYLVSNSIKTA